MSNLLTDFSLEITGKDLLDLSAARNDILPGTRINITYLGAEEPHTRVRAARAARGLGFEPVPHISGRRTRSEEELARFLEDLRAVDAADSVLVIGGDPATPEGPYPDALTLIRSGILEHYGVREVGIAGYPAGHPDIPTAVLWQHLEDKVALLAERRLDTTIVTQFGFDSTPVVEWVKSVRQRGIDAPIRVGVPGPAGIKRLIGFARRFGVGANAMIVKKYGFSLANLMGTAGPDRFLRSLSHELDEAGLDNRVHAHFYTFGGLTATAQWTQKYLSAQEAGA